ncbi:hypothetical protein [Bowmanella yangjiangensis]|uniref:N-acetyltransferase domain-containing protein n=1 Tax=Bowmanella yangjiangensis TaxID=2811230 RepID=A0ABS3CSH6_9ALTE|nr:hypothetical protein [Bowmanella yangjiangensis]MBN7820068.1 hypothetical protein [Bowmanella yangjiangensis]
MTAFALGLLAVSGCLFGASSLQTVKDIGFSIVGLSIDQVCGYLGFILFIIGIALIFSRWALWVFLFLYSRLIDALPDFLDPIYMARPASSMELKFIFNMGEDLFEGGVSSVNQMKAWYKINPNIFWVLRRKGEGKRDPIRGYFCIIPLKADAVKLLKEEQITGQSITTTHISKERNPKSVYVGAIAAKGFKSKGAVLHKMLNQVEILKQKGTKDVFTRPVTEDGIRLVKKFNFSCVGYDEGEKGKLHHLDLLCT